MAQKKVLGEYLTPAKLARELGESPRTLWRGHQRRVGPPRVRVGRFRFYMRQAVEAWLVTREESGAQPRQLMG